MSALYTHTHTDPVPPRFPNIGYLGSTYNIFKGNPYSTYGFDPGFTTHNIFQFTYLRRSTTENGRYSIPDNINVLEDAVCNLIFNTDIIEDIGSYFKSFQYIVDVAKYEEWGASFSASLNYKEIYSETSSLNLSTYVSSSAMCYSYSASTALFDNLNPKFVSDVQNLPVVPTDLTDYIDFLQHWGTHVVSRIYMGGRYGVLSKFSKSDYTYLASTGLDIDDAAGFSAILSLSPNAVTDEERQQAELFNSYRRDYQTFHVGNKPPLNSKSTYDWYLAVDANPLPLYYSINDLSDVLSTEYFPNDENISAKSANLKKAVTEYCQSLEVADITYCVNSGPTPTSKIQVTFSNDYVDMPCGQPYGKFSFPGTHNPNFKSLGTLKKTNSTVHATVLVNINSPSNLIRKATGWTKIFSETTGKASVIRPQCDDGFFSVSDFFCCDLSISDCLVSATPVLPCVAAECLTQCGFLDCNNKRNVSFVEIGFGNGVLGNDCSDNGYQFFRYVGNENKIGPQCLNVNCLSFY